MKLVNETTTEYLEKLKEEAIKKHKRENNELMSDIMEFIIICTIVSVVCLVFSIIGMVNDNSLLLYSTGFIAALFGFGDILLIKDYIKDYQDKKKPLTDEKKESIWHYDENLRIFNENLDKYEKLINVKTLNYTKTSNAVEIEYANTDGVVETMHLWANIKKHTEIQEPMLVLKNEDFVLYEPYFENKCEVSND